MPKLDPKSIQKELEQGTFWPVYWLYGPERLKIREILKRIRLGVLGSEEGALPGGSSWREMILEASEVDSVSVLEEAHSPTLMAGTRLIIIRDAHLLKNSEGLAELLGPARALSELMSVCVFLSKDLDARKKFSKALMDKAAVVSCEEVPEHQREAWISFLAKRRGMELPSDALLKLSLLDPWSLDIVDQEIEKMSIAQAQVDEIAGVVQFKGGTDVFLDSFFRRQLKSALPWSSHYSDRPEEALPLLGLLGWNVKQLVLLISERETKVPAQFRLSPYLADRLRKWSHFWSLSEILALQEALFALDFSVKQTRLLPLGVWTSLILRFCRSA